MRDNSTPTCAFSASANPLRREVGVLFSCWRNIMLTQERLKELLHYDPETGVFTWRVDRGGQRIGEAAGHTDKRGYVSIRLDYAMYRSHQLAWLYVHGEFPNTQIDHKDLNKGNNAIRNLCTTNKQNHENLPLYSNNRSGFRGVHWFGPTGKWGARITHNYKGIHLGYFTTPEEASEAYEAMANKLFTHHKKAA